MSVRSNWLVASEWILAIAFVVAWVMDAPSWALWTIGAALVVVFALSVPLMVAWIRALHRMDRPAMMAATVFGVALIAVSIPLFSLVGEEANTEYAIAWSESDFGTQQMATGASGTEQTLVLSLTDVHPANAVIELTSCNDGAVAGVQQPATISWELAWESHTETGTASCAATGPFTVAVEPQPDIGSVTAGSQSGAVEAAYKAADGNESVTFTLTFSWSRPGAPGGLPLPQPAFAATVSLTATQWNAVANAPAQEEPR